MRTVHALYLFAAVGLLPSLRAQQPAPQTQDSSVVRVPSRVRVSGGVMAGQLLNRTDPTYPEDARAKGIQGFVVLHVIVGKDGSVENAEVISGPPVLAEAAVDAVRQWTYKPFLLNGEPKEVDTTVTVNFNLNRTAPQP